MSLLDLDATKIPLPHNVSVLSVLDKEVAPADAMVIGTNENLSLSASLEQPLLKCLLPDSDAVLVQVCIKC